eukprot:CAMPEP_0197188738 /NCGR_PEP_ID=MMETSP1423-20130617/18388_1 /TAXON_ID=476441 /ORGANISM="Pseudo-nitzschia heimii, Strain UNC1101" /LENGTH=135 /DNA_ID=CAMNT_0042640661 /DNA_START=296 /DNA_END=700 /DNA_ORIENTATION=+
MAQEIEKVAERHGHQGRRRVPVAGTVGGFPHHVLHEHHRHVLVQALEPQLVVKDFVKDGGVPAHADGGPDQGQDVGQPGDLGQRLEDGRPIEPYGETPVHVGTGRDQDREGRDGDSGMEREEPIEHGSLAAGYGS